MAINICCIKDQSLLMLLLYSSLSGELVYACLSVMCVCVLTRALFTLKSFA